MKRLYDLNVKNEERILALSLIEDRKKFTAEQRYIIKKALYSNINKEKAGNYMILFLNSLDIYFGETGDSEDRCFYVRELEYRKKSAKKHCAQLKVREKLMNEEPFILIPMVEVNSRYQRLLLEKAFIKVFGINKVLNIKEESLTNAI
jgi:hypothetical protein